MKTGAFMFAALACFFAAGSSTPPAGSAVSFPGSRLRPQVTFSLKVEAVRVDVLVTQDGRPVSGLQKADFEVLDNGVPQRIDLVTLEHLPLSVVLAFDTSSSLAGEGIRDLNIAGTAVLDAMSKEDLVGLVTFSHIVKLGCEPTSDRARVTSALEEVQADGETSLVDATQAAMMLAESPASRGLVIVFTDGMDTSSWLAPQLVLQAARRMNVVVYAVSAGAMRDPYLRDLTKLTGGSLFQLQSTRNLRDVLVAALGEFRQRYLLSYSPSGVSGDGWHTIEVRVRNRRATVQARPGYLKGAQ